MKFRKYISLIIPVIIGVTVVLYFFNPSESKLFPPCPFHYVTGLYCPGCGSLRAIHHLLHGNIFVAFYYNPLTVILLPLTFYLFLSQPGLVIKGKRLLPKLNIHPVFYWILIAVTGAYWIIRNIPLGFLQIPVK